MTPEQLVDVADMRYLSDALTRDEAIGILTEPAPHPQAGSALPGRLIFSTPCTST